MNDSTRAEDGAPKPRSFSDTLSRLQPIVPLPGLQHQQAPPAVPPAAPTIPEAELPEEAGPQAIPLPPAFPEQVVAAPRPDPSGAGLATVPLPGSVPSRPFSVPTPTPSATTTPAPIVRPTDAAEPGPDAKLDAEPDAEPDMVIPPMPAVDALARPDLAAAAAPSPAQRRLWPWIAAGALTIAAGTATLWLRQPPTPIRPAALPEAAAPVAPAPGPAAVPAAPTGTAAPVAAPTETTASEPQADPAAVDVPEPSLAATVAPIPEPPPELPTPPAPEPQVAASQVPDPPEPALPTPPPLPAPLRIEHAIIFHRADSSSAEEAARRLAEQLRLLSADVETRAATANFRLPTIRYFHADDATGAQRLAAALSQPGAEWRVAGILTRRSPPQPGTLEVWLAVR